jgi:hypothetical protein
MDRDEVLQDLRPLMGVATVTFRKAVKRAREAPSLDLLDRSKTSNSNLARDYALAELQRAWFGNASVKLVTVNRAQLFVVDQKYAIRIKKLDENSRSRNVRTKQSRLFQYQGQLDGMPPLCNLDLGYVMAPDGLTVKDVRLVCLNGNKPFWVTSLESPDSSNYDLFPNVRGPAPSEPKGPTPKTLAGNPGVVVKPKKK